MEKNIKRMSFAALAALAMVSCSNHDEWMTYEELMAAKYDAAFVQKYGNIDPNHTWGFGATTRAVTRATSTQEQMEDAINEAFKEWFETNWDNVFNFPESEAGALYVKENKTVQAATIYTQNIYVYPGATLTISDHMVNDGTCIYVAKGANLVFSKTDGGVQFKGKLYNAGEVTIKCPASSEFQLHNGAKFYNGGTVTCSSKINTSSSVIFNEGTFKVTATADECLKFDASSKFYNGPKGVVELSGGTEANGVFFANLGSYTTGKFRNSNNDQFYNGCKLFVKGEFSLRSNMVAHIMDDGYVEADYLVVDDACSVEMGNHSGFYIKNGTTSGHEAKPLTFTTSGVAAVALNGTIKTQYLDNAVITFDGNITYVVEKYNCQGDASEQARKHIVGKNGAKEYSALKITPNTNGCGATWNTDNPNLTQGLTKGRIFCEDLGSTGDFDFNDVVFDAEIRDGRIYITLYAAGGILDVTVAGVNVHEWLGEGIVNTGVKTGERSSYAFDVPADGITAIEDIPVIIEANKDAEYSQRILLKNEIGHAPQKICVPLDTKWVKEYEDISNAYPKFKQYVGNSSIGTKAFTEEIIKDYLY